MQKPGDLAVGDNKNTLSEEKPAIMFRDKILFFGSLLFCASMSAQEKIIDTVRILDSQLLSSGKTQQIYRIKNSDFSKNSTSLSEILRFQSPIHIRENGAGLSSSPGFRGTSAQQTSFLWNGLPINSLFLGQADINNLGFFGYDEVEIKAGGGSVIYGSGAIGGTVHLSNKISYDKGWERQLFFEGGSFGSYNSAGKISFSNKNLSINSSAYLSSSENNYNVPEKFYKNLNGSYRKFTFDIGAGYRLNSHNEIIWQSQNFEGLQHFPVSSENAPKSQYKTYSFRSLLGWNFYQNRLENRLSTAYLEEDFSYYADGKDFSNGGKGKTFIIKDDALYGIFPKLKINLLSEYKKILAEGYNSGISHPERSSLSMAALLKLQPNKKFYAEAGVKKEWMQDYDTPVLFSAGMRYKKSDFYTLKFNASKNFRYPTFNDLYWQPGGNPRLKPETALQAELGNEFSLKNFSLKVTPYFISVKNMIVWLPKSGNIWSPENVYNVHSAGVDTEFDFRKNFGRHLLNFSGGYSYTHSENMAEHKILVYTPQHKFFSGVNWEYLKINAYVQGMYTGKVFGTPDNAENYALPGYFLMNGGVAYRFLEGLKIGFNVKNITDKVYETTSYFPMPKRNFSANINYNF